MRRFIRYTLLLVTVVVVACGLLQHWLARRVKEQVVAALEKVYGGPVRLRHAHLGVNGTALYGLELFEEGDPNGQPWLRIDRINADITLAGALSGNVQPGELRLSGADLTLRFNDQGHLLTRWPAPLGDNQDQPRLPRLVLRDSRVRFRRADGTELVLSDVNATVERAGDGLTIRGAFRADRWGPWAVAGAVDGGRLEVTFGSAGAVPVTPAMLRQLPFVPDDVWREVQLSGATPGQVTLTFDPARPPLHYRVELEPRHTRLHVRALDLDAEDAAGRVVIEDGVVRLRDVTGRVSGGRLATDADLDFNGSTTKFDFARLEINGVPVQRLPRGWGLPRELEGVLSARLGLRLEIEDGKLRTRGTGAGELRAVRVAGTKVNEPVRLTLRDRSADLKEPAALLVEAQASGLELAEVLRGVGIPACQPAKDGRQECLPHEQKDRPPVEVSGRLAVHARATLPLDTIADPATYRVTGAVDVTQGRVETLAVDRLHADVSLQGGKLRLHGVAAEGPALSVSGEATAALLPAGDLNLDVTVRRLDLAALAKLLRVTEPLRGAAAGTLTAEVAVKDWDRPEAWRGSAALTVPKADIGDLALRNGTATARLTDGRLTVSAARAQVEGATLTASAQVGVSKPYPVHGRLELRQADLAALDKLPAAWRPPHPVGGRLNADVEVRGALQPWLLTTQGTAAIDDLQFAKLRSSRVTARWRSDNDVLLLDDLNAALAQGKVQGSARLPLRGPVAGSVDLRVTNVDAAALVKEVLDAPPVALSGKVSGTVTVSLSPEQNGRRRVEVAAEVPGNALRVQRVPVEHLKGTLTWAQPALAYHLDAHVAGGVVKLDGQLATGAAVKGAGRLRVEKLGLGSLSTALRTEPGEPLLHGQLELDLPYQHNGDGVPLGVGRFTVTRLRYGGSDVSGDVRGDLQLLKQEVLVRELSGELGQGTLRGKFAWHYHEPQRRWFSVTLENVEARRLLSPWPGVAAQVQGSLWLHAAGRLEREWHGTAEARLQGGKVAGAEVAEWRLPVEWAFAPETGRATFEARESSAQVGGGRVTAQASLSVDGAVRLQGKASFANVDLGALLPGHVDNAALTGGKVSGKAEFTAEDLRNPNPLTATLDATLAQTRSLDVPVFKQVLAVVGVAPAATFQKGDVRARLAGEVIRVERLTLDSGAVQLYATGTATTQGRLNLDVTARTGRAGLTAGLLRQLGVPLSGEVGSGPLAQVRQLFSVRLLHLLVTGTVREPVVQVQPLRELPQEALRFFIDGIRGLR
jgi:uncharacterized protein involved in outer membrane biogenesis